MIKEVKVGGLIYKVVCPYLFKERGDLAAQADHTELLIRIAEADGLGKYYKKEKLSEAILHEIVHCIDSVYNNQSLSENQVESMSNGLFQVLKDNDLSELFR